MNDRAASFGALKRYALIAAAIGVVLMGVGFLFARDHFFRAYLLGFSIFLALSLGSLAVVMLHHMTGGAWGFVLRRVLEAGMTNLPLLAVLSVPILLSLPELYIWARPEEVARDHVLQKKAPYLNADFFMIRTAIYFAIWSAYAFLLRRWSLLQDRASPADAAKLSKRMELISGPGLVIFAMTVTFASVDYLMSLEPHWFSTIYALLMMVIQALMALAFGTAVIALMRGTEALRSGDAANHFHDLGNLMLAFVMLWAYMMLSQYLIIWAGNLPEEIPWYISRTKTGWGGFALALVFGHFALPFVFLLFRSTKRNVRALSLLACFLLVMILVDFVWFISPAFYPDGVSLHWLDPAALLAIGGVWIFMFAGALERRPLVPARDPELPEALAVKGAVSDA